MAYLYPDLTSPINYFININLYKKIGNLFQILAHTFSKRG